METVFVAGSIAINRLDQRVKDRIESAVKSGLTIAVGDADGADTSFQEHLRSIDAKNVTVFCTGLRPRNNIGAWPVESVHSDAAPGTREFFTAKDRRMAEVADYGLMVWDAKSAGTLSNVIQLVRFKKKSVVFINKSKKFVTVSDAKSLESLVEFMSVAARDKVEKKVGLSKKIMELSQEQLALNI